MSDLDRVHLVDQADEDVSRRTLLRGVAIGGLALPVLAACGGEEDPSSSSSSSSSDPESSGAAGGVTVATADVPVGGGTILEDEKLVVTQPSKGEYKAFTAVCTHRQCLVTKIEDSQIVCPCHGSHFSIADGSAVAGPAESPLAAKKVAVKGSRLTVT